MLKWKRISSGTILADKETLVHGISGLAGKNRRIVKACFTPTDNKFLRVYRDADQIVDFDSYTLNGEPPFIDMDLPLADGQECKVGFYNDSGATDAIEIMIAYEESD